MNGALARGFPLAATAVAAAVLVRGAQPLAFEVATVKPAAPQSFAGGPMPPPPPPPGGVVGDRVTWTNMSLHLLIGAAYGLKDYQVASPDWMKDVRFDISAKMPAGATTSQAPAMLRTLLEERFQLTSHREQRELPVYALIVAKNGPKLQEVITPDRGLRLEPQRGNDKLTGQASMGLVATILSLQLDRPVIDMTGLHAVYRFDVSWAPGDNEKNYAPNEATGIPQGALPAAPSIFTALEETLGIKLDSRKAPTDVLVIDHAERNPTAN